MLQLLTDLVIVVL